MVKKNKIIKSIYKNVMPKLPITVHYITTQKIARNELEDKIMNKSPKITIHFYESTENVSYGYHKSISKIINFADEK